MRAWGRPAPHVPALAAPALDLGLDGGPGEHEAPANDFEARDARCQQRCCRRPAGSALGVQAHAHETQARAQGLVELQVVDHLYHRAGAGQHHQAQHPEGGVAAEQPSQLAESGDAQVHHHQAGQAPRRIDHHEQEDQAQVEQPGLGELRQQHQRQHHQHRADDGPEEEHRAAQEGEQQIRARARRPHDLGGDDLEVERRQPAGNPHEEAAGDEREVAHVPRAVADELHALGVVAHRIEHAPQGRQREGVHRRGADEAVERDQVVQLDGRPEADAQHRRPGDAVAADAALAAEEAREHQRHRPHQLAHAQRDHRERRAGLPGRHIAQQHGEQPAKGAGDQRDQAHRQRQRTLADQVQRVDGEERPQAGVHGMAEAQHAALPQQHVEGQAGDDRDADLRQHGHGQAGAEDQGRDQQQRGISAPDQPALAAHGAGTPHLQPSREPNRPRGLKIRISTSSR
jgi:hypothetical protein